jgi:hypothetical protein
MIDHASVSRLYVATKIFTARKGYLGLNIVLDNWEIYMNGTFMDRHNAGSY